MIKKKWDLSIDGQLEDEPLVRIDDVNWGGAKNFGLDPDMTGLAIGTEHVDAKIELSRELIDIHSKHAETDGPSNAKGLLPENVMDRLVYGMTVAGAGKSTIPNALLRLLSLRLKVSRKPRDAIQNEAELHRLYRVVAENPGIGKKKAAKAVGVSPNTAKKWMDNPEFKKFVALLKKHEFKGVN